MYIKGYMSKEGSRAPSLLDDPYSVFGGLGGLALGLGAADLFGKSSLPAYAAAGGIGALGGGFLGSRYGQYVNRPIEQPRSLWRRGASTAVGAGSSAVGGLNRFIRWGAQKGQDMSDLGKEKETIREIKKRREALAKRIEQELESDRFKLPGNEEQAKRLKERLDTLRSRTASEEYLEMRRGVPAPTYRESLSSTYEPITSIPGRLRERLLPSIEDVRM